MSCAMAMVGSARVKLPHNKAGARRKKGNRYPWACASRYPLNANKTEGKSQGLVVLGALNTPGGPRRRAVRHAGRFGSFLEQAQQVAVDRVIGGDDTAGREHRVAAVEVADEPAGLAHQRDSGRHVP